MPHPVGGVGVAPKILPQGGREGGSPGQESGGKGTSHTVSLHRLTGAWRLAGRARDKAQCWGQVCPRQHLASNAERVQGGRTPPAAPGSQHLLWVTEGKRGLAIQVGTVRGACRGVGAAVGLPCPRSSCARERSGWKREGKIKVSLASCARRQGVGVGGGVRHPRQGTSTPQRLHGTNLRSPRLLTLVDWMPGPGDRHHPRALASAAPAQDAAMCPHTP